MFGRKAAENSNPVRHARHIERTKAIREVNPTADAKIVANCLEVSESTAAEYLREAEAS
jgi:hypothetical protein